MEANIEAQYAVARAFRESIQKNYVRAGIKGTAIEREFVAEREGPGGT